VTSVPSGLSLSPYEETVLTVAARPAASLLNIERVRRL
jgi:hypothetical protein